MTLATRTPRTSIAWLVAAVAVVMVAPAHAGNRATPATCEESTARSRGNSNSESTAAASRRENTSLEPSDEAYVPLSRTPLPVAHPSAAPRPSEIAPAHAPTPRAEKPAVARKAPAPPAAPGRTRAQAPGKTKLSIPNLPAQPGMGTLLRVGITAGREIS